jgi:hypothetical protein
MAILVGRKHMHDFIGEMADALLNLSQAAGPKQVYHPWPGASIRVS